MRYRIEYADGRCCNFANSRKDLLDWLKLLKDEQIVDIRKIYESGVKKYTKDHIIVTEAISKDLIPLIADNSEAKDNIAKEFKENPMHALETVMHHKVSVEFN